MANKHYLLVDGYNIIHHWPELRNQMAIDLETSRKSLIDTMAEYAKSSGVRVLIVFDAYEPTGNGSHEVKKGIEIIFTRENETADAYIERLVARLTSRSRRNIVRVASSDGMIQNIVLGRGATRLSASELKQVVVDQKNSNQRIREKLKKDIHKNLVDLGEENLKKIDKFIEELNKED